MPSVQQILQRHIGALRAERKLSAPQSRAASALVACRTAALGGHVQRCPNGHVDRVWYNSCRHRSCPQCNALAREQWLSRTRARLVDCAHHHLVFTIDHELNVLWMLNTAAMMAALFGAVRDTLSTLLADPRYLGAQPGIVLALHTWGRSLALHPHIHALVTDGGWWGGQWIAPRRSHFLPARVVMTLFRGKFLAALRHLEETGALRLPDGLSAERLKSLFNRVGRKKWNVRLVQRYAHGRGVAMYLARYVKGGAMSNRQIVRANEHEVVFAYTAHGEDGGPGRRTAMRLSPTDFLARVLMHAPERGRQTVRYYGLYAHGCTQALANARAAHGQTAVEPPEPISWQGYLQRLAPARDHTRCPICGASLVRGMRIAALGRAPP
jgi:Putative transposase/Transposase zinc-binding domain